MVGLRIESLGVGTRNVCVPALVDKSLVEKKTKT
jgi:hypothetical protein